MHLLIIVYFVRTCFSAYADTHDMPEALATTGITVLDKNHHIRKTHDTVATDVS